MNQLKLALNAIAATIIMILGVIACGIAAHDANLVNQYPNLVEIGGEDPWHAIVAIGGSGFVAVVVAISHLAAVIKEIVADLRAMGAASA